jgi:hypothetical protein
MSVVVDFAKRSTTPLACPNNNTPVMLRLRHPTSEFWSCPGQFQASNVFALAGPKVIRIGAALAVVEHFCRSLMGAAAKTLSAQKRSRITSEIMWTAGLHGHRTTNWTSSAWKISFLLLGVLWLRRGLLLHSMTTPRQWVARQYLWTPKNSIAEGHNFFGVTFVET